MKNGKWYVYFCVNGLLETQEDEGTATIQKRYINQIGPTSTVEVQMSGNKWEKTSYQQRQ